MLSSSAVFARPVRTPAKSLRKSSTAFSIRVFACASASFVLAIVVISSASRSYFPARASLRSLRLCGKSFRFSSRTAFSRRDHRSDFLAHHHALQIPRHIHIENQNRHFVVHAQRNRRRIHYRKAFLNHVEVRNLLEHSRALHFFRVRVVHA